MNADTVAEHIRATELREAEAENRAAEAVEQSARLKAENVKLEAMLEAKQQRIEEKSADLTHALAELDHFKQRCTALETRIHAIGMACNDAVHIAGRRPAGALDGLAGLSGQPPQKNAPMNFGNSGNQPSVSEAA